MKNKTPWIITSICVIISLIIIWLVIYIIENNKQESTNIIPPIITDPVPPVIDNNGEKFEPPAIIHKPNIEQEETDAELEIDMGEIQNNNTPGVIDFKVEYGSKEIEYE